MIRRTLPILCLVLLSPLVAEYLSGSLPAAMITILPLMAAMYGSGAVLIREAAVRGGGGWPVIALLGAAYGVVEEGWVDQSLFNPDFEGLRLLDFGYVAALGTGLPWLIYVIAIHVVWSIATPIALTNCLFPARRNEPWLARWGIVLFVLLYLAANAAVASYWFSSSHFMATPGELAWTGGVVLVLLVLAVLVSRRHVPLAARDAPASALLVAIGFVPGSALLLIVYFGQSALYLPWPAVVAIQVALGAASAALLVTLERRRWTAGQYVALTAGLLLVYVFGGFLTSATLHGRSDLPGHAVIAVICLAALGLAWRRSRPAVPSA